MNTADLKLDIFNKLNFIEDEQILRNILNFISKEENLYYEFDEKQKIKVLNSLKQYKEGDFLESNIAEQDIEKWLKD